jgi:hypothetical protein
MKLEKLDVDRYVETRICNLLEVQYNNADGTARRVEEHFCVTVREEKPKEEIENRGKGRGTIIW